MISNLFNSTFRLYSNEITGRDSMGGVTRGLVLKYTKACYDTYILGQEQYVYGKRIVVAERRLFCLPNIQITTTNLVRIVDEDGDNWYAVLYIDDCDDLQHHYEIDLLGIEAPQEVYESSSSETNSYSSSSITESLSSSSSESSKSTSSESSSTVAESTTSSMSSSTSSITESLSSSSSKSSNSLDSSSSESSLSSWSNITSTSSMSSSSTSLDSSSSSDSSVSDSSDSSVSDSSMSLSSDSSMSLSSDSSQSISSDSSISDASSNSECCQNWVGSGPDANHFSFWHITGATESAVVNCTLASYSQVNTGSYELFIFNGVTIVAYGATLSPSGPITFTSFGGSGINGSVLWDGDTGNNTVVLNCP